MSFGADALRSAALGGHSRRSVGHKVSAPGSARSFIEDFLAPRERLVVEVDGGYHFERLAADARPDRKLARLGYHVLRPDAELMVSNLDEALARIRAALSG